MPTCCARVRRDRERKSKRSREREIESANEFYLSPRAHLSAVEQLRRRRRRRRVATSASNSRTSRQRTAGSSRPARKSGGVDGSPKPGRGFRGATLIETSNGRVRAPQPVGERERERTGQTAGEQQTRSHWPAASYSARPVGPPLCVWPGQANWTRLGINNWQPRWWATIYRFAMDCLPRPTVRAGADPGQELGANELCLIYN